MLKTMKWIGVTAIALVLSGATQPKQSAVRFNAPEDVKGIEAVETVLATEKDMKKLIEYYAPDAVVIDMFAPDVFRGREQIYAGFAPQMEPIKSMTHSIPELVIATNGNFGCAASQISFDSVMKDGKKMKINIRQLNGYKKINGRWMLVQQHVALPIDPKTMQATMAAPIMPRKFTWSKNPIQPASATREQSIKEIHQFMEVGGASQGLDMLMSYYGPGDDLLLYDSFHPAALVGRKEVRDYYAPLMNSYKDIKLSMPMFVADADGSLGIQIDTQLINLTMNDGSTRKIALRQSDCMRRVSGKWYSALEMVSYAVDPRTMRGLIEPAANTK